MANGTIKKIETSYTNQYRTEDFGTSTTVTPTHDGWLVARGKVTSQQSLQPIIRITHNGDVLNEGIGLVTNTTVLHTAAPAVKGVTYEIVVYRCALESTILYY